MSHRKVCETLYENLNSIIEQGQLKDKKVYMFGYSRIMCMIVGYLKKDGIQIQGIIDNSKEKQGKVFDGMRTYSPDILSEYDKDVVVMIASSYQKEMVEQLEHMGYI